MIDTNKNEKNILREYKAKKQLYKKFTAAVASVFENMLSGYKCHLDRRVKELESLKKKIERKALQGKIYEKLEDVKDIAGVRIIFYTANDRTKFIKKMRKVFKGHLEIKRAAKVSGYRAIHAIISLDKNMLKKHGYEIFEGLRCEVQLCLILEHAWAEIEHDILYKENWGFRKLDAEQYVYMKERMEGIMTNHIEKASGELERVVAKFKKLKRENKRSR